MTFTFEREDILDEEGNLINICIITTLPGFETPMIFSQHGGLGISPLTGKKYVKDSSSNDILSFDLIDVDGVQYGVYYDDKGSMKVYCVVNGTMYLNDGRGFEIVTTDSNYKTITVSESERYTLIEE